MLARTAVARHWYQRGLDLNGRGNVLGKLCLEQAEDKIETGKKGKSIRIIVKKKIENQLLANPPMNEVTNSGNKRTLRKKGIKKQDLDTEKLDSNNAGLKMKQHIRRGSQGGWKFGILRKRRRTEKTAGKK